MEHEGGRIRLRFDYTTGGLSARNGELRGFAIAGPDHRFVPAKVQIEGETLMAWADTVRAPEAVRYGWANAPVATLFNGAGLPASPFRTDGWPGITEGRLEPDEY